MASDGFNWAASLLFTLEVYHAIAHICILFRLRMLPKKDLVRVKYYFLVDLLTVTCSALYTRELLWLAFLQNLQHLYFFFSWNKSSYCIRVIEWSSLDWMVKPRDTEPTKGSLEKANNSDRVDVTAGTFFDMMVHVVYAYYLTTYVGIMEALASAVVLLILTKLVLFNEKFAWSSPEKVPYWVGKRLTKIDPSKKRG